MVLGVVVVTYESSAVLPGLLSDLAANESDARVVVVDNASPSGPPAVAPPADLVVLDRNRGYGAGCNAGAERLVDATHFAFLNPDIRLGGPSLTQLAAGLAERLRAGVTTGPVVNTQGERVASVWGPTSAARALWMASGWQAPRLRRAVGRVAGRGAGRGAFISSASLAHDELLVEGHVLGGAMVVDAQCFAELGGFDERFFMFWEDADFCHRARQRGWTVHLLPAHPIEHAAGTSSAGVRDAQRWQWYVEGADRFTQQHLSPARAAAVRAALRAGHRLRRR
jgi:GT2 family glycosyltransferase